MRAAIENALMPLDAYVAEHGALNAVLMAFMLLVLVVATAGLLRVPRPGEPPGQGLSPVVAPVVAPVLPSQRGLQDRAPRAGGQ